MMGRDFSILAKLELPIQGQPLSKVTGLLLSDILLIIAAALTLLLGLVLWAKYLRNRKPKKRRAGGQKVFRGSNSGGEDEEEEEDGDKEAEEEAREVRRRYKYRYKRRSHRNRNPTLAETGGLPPARSEESTERS